MAQISSETGMPSFHDTVSLKRDEQEHIDAIAGDDGVPRRKVRFSFATGLAFLVVGLFVAFVFLR